MKSQTLIVIYMEPGNRLFWASLDLSIFRGGALSVPASVNLLTKIFVLEQSPWLIYITLLHKSLLRRGKRH